MSTSRVARPRGGGGPATVRPPQAKGDGYGNRAACWIARAALESAVDDLLVDRKSAAPAATTRSKLTVLEVANAQNPEVHALAGYVWSGLSRASHHGFELTPAAAEVQH